MSAGEWIETKWGELASLEYGKSLRDYVHHNGEIPVFGTNGQIGFTNKSLCPFPSVIVGRKGAYRGIHYSSKPFFVIDTAFYVKPKSDELNLKFAYYQLLTYDINGMDSGSAIPSTSREDFYNLPITLPDLPTQTRIASILSALDDKIELNRQANATLEAIAQAIFKEWFVDFRYPGATGERQDVGTGGMNWAGLEPAPTHLIPKGWRVGTFADFVEISGGGTPKTTIDEYWNGGIPWFSVADAPHESDVFVVDTEKKISQAGVNNSSTKLLREGTTIISARGTVGKVALCGVSMAMNQSCYAINGKQDDWGFFTYYLTRSISLQLQQGANGSVFDTITRSTFEQLTVVLPPPELIASYNNVVTPIFLKIKDHLYQSTILTQARDALLPKLMNGDIPVGAGSKPALSCSQPAQSFGTNTRAGLEPGDTRAGLEPAPTQFVGMASLHGSS